MVLGKSYILFDPELLSTPCLEVFSSEVLAERGLVTGWAPGRGRTCFFRWQGQDWALRHFYRGGIIAPVLKDRYLGLNVEKTRSWKEWHLLHVLFNQSLPVPRPVAARVVMHLGQYQADLITVTIPNSRSLEDCLRQRALSKELWSSIGSCLRKFHDLGVYHADLNAKNILLDGEEKMYLIDFDQCKISSSTWWKKTNLKRLHRSLQKNKARHAPFYFGQDDWANLLHGYALTSR